MPKIVACYGVSGCLAHAMAGDCIISLDSEYALISIPGNGFADLPFGRNALQIGYLASRSMSEVEAARQAGSGVRVLTGVVEQHSSGIHEPIGFGREP